MAENLQKEKKIRNWKSSVESSGCTVQSLKPISEIRKSDGSLLFALLDTDVISPEGNKLPHVVFIRGHACVIVPLLLNRDTGEERYLMVHQRRIGNGHMSLEFPAGMLDENSDASDVAIQELMEETGLEASRDELVPLTDKMLYSSAGACDEAVFYYGIVKEMGDDEFRSFNGRQGGCAHEHEFISTALMTREEAEKQATSLQVRLGFFLFDQKMKRNG
ncbi:MAG: NUDIX hydrolase [Chitinispirillaceae bacterium]